MTEQDDRTYIRVHDGMPEHWKVEDLSDSAFRQIITIWCWCARQRTDGFVPERKWLRIGSESDRTELLDAGLIETVKGGVRCHDYLKHQRSRDAIRARSDASRIANHTRWHVKLKRVDPTCDLCKQDSPGPGRSDSESDSDPIPTSDRTPTSSDRMSNGVPDQIRSEESKAETVGSPRADVTDGQSVRVHARANEAIRWVANEYRLTERESSTVWAEAEQRSAKPIKHPVPYLKKMADEGDLADIVAAVLDAGEAREQPPPPAPEPLLRSVPDLPVEPVTPVWRGVEDLPGEVQDGIASTRAVLEAAAAKAKAKKQKTPRPPERSTA